MTLTVINTAICVALFWSCFCRLVRTDDSTYPAVRLGFAALGAGALASAVAPWVWGTCTNWPSTTLAAGMLLAQGLKFIAVQNVFCIPIAEYKINIAVRQIAVVNIQYHAPQRRNTGAGADEADIRINGFG